MRPRCRHPRETNEFRPALTMWARATKRETVPVRATELVRATAVALPTARATALA